jgi:oligosaccharide translocation protein RFT1
MSVLFFARESLRVAIQREADTVEEPPAEDDVEKVPERKVDVRTVAGRTQAIVNLAYLSISLGVIFAVLLAALYRSGLRSSDPAIIQTPYFQEALKLYGLATIWELLSEPCFVVVQQKSRLKIRASAESVGTLLRCLVTCGSAVWAARNGRDLGVLPFALGQGVYAVSLSAVYYRSVWSIASSGHFSLFLGSIYSRYSLLAIILTRNISNGSSHPESFLFSYFSWSLLTRSGSLFIQGILKHFLTQGDTFMISTLASAHDQGIYALVNNYGGLVARLFLQPVEESSRNYFGKLLSSSNGPPSRPRVETARNNLEVLLRAYVLLSVFLLAVGPTLAPLLLKIVAGARWTNSGAGHVLATFCYYIPLLAINGLTESFVSSVATEMEVNRQSVWMLAFSAGFGGAAFFFVRFLGLGAEGLVWANILNMSFRIIWSTSFISSFMMRNGMQLEYITLLPKPPTLAAAVVIAEALRRLDVTFTGGIVDLWKAGVISGVFLVSV